MKYRVLDNNILIEIWHGKWPGGKPVRSEAAAAAEPQKWLKKFPNDAILTPVRLEFLGGARDRDDLRLCDTFLSEFDVLDEGKVLEADWKRAEHFSRWIRDKGRSRGAIDSLLRAICERVNAELYTRDTGI
jgi:predicted nucleic acid-binding protein